MQAILPALVLACSACGTFVVYLQLYQCLAESLASICSRYLDFGRFPVDERLAACGMLDLMKPEAIIETIYYTANSLSLG
jgi:hypothetical protein